MKFLTWGCGCLAFCGTAWASISEAQLQSYQLIPERNAFGLKPPPPPVEVTNNAPPPAVKVTFTGITSGFGGKRAYFMIPDLTRPGTFTYPILKEGDQEGTLKVMENGIDEKSGTVRIMNGSVAMTLTFEKDGNKAAAGPAVAGGAAAPGVPGANPAVKIPPPPGIIQPATHNLPLPTPTAAGTVGSSSANVATIGGNNSLSTLPSRSIRTQAQPIANTVLPPQSQEESIVNLEIQRQLNADKIATGDFPPLPPTVLSEGDGGMPSLPGAK